MAKRLESQLLSEILLEFGALPQLTIWRNSVGATRVDSRFIKFGLTGSADILGVADGGKFIAIEAKSDTGRLTKEQVVFRRVVERHGGLYILARSCDDVRAGLQSA